MSLSDCVCLCCSVSTATGRVILSVLAARTELTAAPSVSGGTGPVTRQSVGGLAPLRRTL